jgi:hypothetical protein
MENSPTNITEEYNQNSSLLRAALSPSYSIGFLAGVLTYFVSPDIKNNRSSFTDFAINGSLTIPAAIASASQNEQVASVARYMAIGSILVDASGLGTKKPFGAMRAGFAEGRLGFSVS